MRIGAIDQSVCAPVDGKFIVSNEIQINIEGEIVEATESAAEAKDDRAAKKS